MPHYVVSAKEGHNVEQAFAVLVKDTLRRADLDPVIDIGLGPGTFVLGNDPQPTSGSICSC
jgi:hypothetical protein